MVQSLDKKLCELTFAAFDVETTGLNPARDRVVEIGAVGFDRDGVREEFERLVNPLRPIPHDATAIHGITDSEVASSPPMREILPRIIEFFDDSILVAHNAPFDIGFFGAAIAEAGVNPPPNPIVCTVELSRAMFPEAPNHKLETLVRMLGISDGGEHRGLADSINAVEVFKRCVERMSSGWSASLGDLLNHHGPLFHFGNPNSRWLETIEEALKAGAALKIEYRSQGGGVTEREITPLRVEGYGRKQRVVAFCHLRKENRTFLLDNIKRFP